MMGPCPPPKLSEGKPCWKHTQQADQVVDWFLGLGLSSGGSLEKQGHSGPASAFRDTSLQPSMLQEKHHSYCIPWALKEAEELINYPYYS